MLFISTQKLFSFLRYLNFCPEFFVHVRKRRDQEAEVNFKMSDVINRKKIVAIHVLPNISKIKGNQTMKFGQFIEYNIRSIFLQNHAENEKERLLPDLLLFPKKNLYELKASFPLRENLSKDGFFSGPYLDTFHAVFSTIV